jgi:hypothetical protein
MLRILLSLSLLFAIALPCSAQGGKAKPNTLTPKEIADGWILLFDGETTSGWKVVRSSEKGKVKVTDGTLDLTELGIGNIESRARFDMFDLAFEYMVDKGSGNIAVEVNGFKGHVGSRLILDQYAKWTPVTVRVFAGRLKFDSHSYQPWDHICPISFVQLGGASLQLRNIKLRPLNTTSLFNGKDLTGWKTFPGDKYKSKFSVNDKGELNVKDGPGDLQTVGKFKDFILQLECISNDKHLNSGIFFRCRDNEYQNGYEAQIRNQFTKEPTQKYLIEEYDPKTNKLVGKKEILSTAFDFGTGAIYRRVPARKEMSKDGEWFSMTIAAQGNHFATWVNGVQVTDWTDNRPKSDNARTGCRLEAGHLSIQGHDPTTDLSFRNLRIAEMK